MPLYTVLHRSCIPKEARKALAEDLTRLHTSVTSTEAFPGAVKVMFIDLDSDSLFVGGDKVDAYVRVIGQIRRGRTEEQKLALLSGMYQIMEAAVHGCEIQTQITEIDDTKTVMTNGSLNT